MSGWVDKRFIIDLGFMNECSGVELVLGTKAVCLEFVSILRAL